MDEDQKRNWNAWKVKVEDIKEFNLDIKNPNDVEVTQNLSPSWINWYNSKRRGKDNRITQRSQKIDW